MAMNEVYADAKSLSYAVNSAVVAGNFVVLGGVNASASATGIIGVAETSAKLGADGNYYATLRHDGVFTGTTTDTAAITVGAPLYLASAATYGSALTATSTSNKFVGYAYAAKGSTTGTQTITVRINN
jgi:predicted RecA/RadA family phage recombinase